MYSGIRRIAVVLLPLCVACGWGFGQTDSKALLDSRIHDAESAAVASSSQRDGAPWLQLAILYQDAARFEDAERAYRQAVHLLKKQNRTAYANALDLMGTMYVQRGRFSKAEPLERKALEIRLNENDPVAVGKSYMHLAMLAFGQNDLRGAETNAGMAVSLLVPEHSIHERREEATPEEKMSALIDLSLVRCAEGACASAIHDLERALRLAQANYENKSLAVGLLRFLLGYAYWKSSNAKEAAELMKSGIDEMEPQLGWGHPTYIAALKQYRLLLVQNGDDVDAAKLENRVAKLEGSSKSNSRAESRGLFGFNALR